MKQLLLAFSLLLAAGFVVGCPSTVTVPRLERPDQEVTGEVAEAPAGLDCAYRIQSAQEWDALAFRPEFHNFARTEIVKFVIDTRDESHGTRVYFLQSLKWDLHYAFVAEFIDPRENHGQFNIAQYRRPDRRYLLGSLVHYLDGGQRTLELVAGDTMSAEQLERTFSLVKERVYFADDLRYRALSTQQEAHAESLGDRVPSIRIDDIMDGAQYQPVVTGVTFGYLRLVRGTLDVAQVQPNDLLVTENVPMELPPVSGIITSALQAPLAHVAVLSRNRNTPDMALRDAITDERLVRFEGRLVRLSVGPQDFTITEARLEEAQADWRSRRPSTTFRPVLDESRQQLRELCDVGIEDTASVGAKAAQLGEVCAAGERFMTPRGFAIPLARYFRHLREHHIDERLSRTISATDFREDRGVRAAELEAIRVAIAGAEIDATLVRDIHRRVSAYGDRRTIFRSSTNAEDLVGFNGAGLYESVVVDAHPTRAQVRDALAKVWASVWLQRAYEEREWYRIDHERVGMGVLIQPFVDDVIGNGVAITKNPFDEGRPGVFVNVQQGGSVTGAGGDEMPEQIVVYTWAQEFEPEVLRRSTLTDGAPILTPEDTIRLTHLLTDLHILMTPLFAPPSNAVDVEFLLTRAHEFVIVQARPYTVVYTEGQRYRTR